MDYSYDTSAIGARIKRLRKQNGDTQAVLAEKLQVSVDTVKRMENGTVSNTCILWMAAKEYGVTLDYLVSGREDSLPENCPENLRMDEILGECSMQERAFIWSTLLCTAEEMKKNLSHLTGS